MTPEEYAATCLTRITMKPQGRWDADVVEFETTSMETDEFAAMLTAAIRAALAEEREACAQLMCAWCRFKPHERYGLATVAPSVDAGDHWSHQLTYKSGETAWTECDAAAIRARS